MASTISRERVERVARMYRTNQMASAALGIHLGTFSRLCRKYGIQTPHERKMATGVSFKPRRLKLYDQHPFVRRTR